MIEELQDMPAGVNGIQSTLPHAREGRLRDTSQLAFGVAGKQPMVKGLGAKVPPQPLWRQL